MAKITFINVQDPKIDADVVAHGHGCRDIKRTLNRNPFNELAGGGEFATSKDAFEDYNFDFIAEDPESAWQIKFYPCCNF